MDDGLRPTRSWRPIATGWGVGLLLGLVLLALAWRHLVHMPPGAPVRVAAVIDGDTLELDDGTRVRLIGIDTPETGHPALDGPQPYGAAAAERLRELIADRTVHLERDRTPRDHYGRLLRHVWVGRTLVAERLVREGLAYAHSVPPDVRYRAQIRAAEDAARAAGRGVWAAPAATPIPLFRTPRR